MVNRGTAKSWRGKNYYRRKPHLSKREKPSKQSPVYRNAVRVNCASSLSEKWLFHSEGAANNAIEFNARDKKMRGKPVKYERAYYCKACNGFHITTMEKSQWHKRKDEIWRKMGTNSLGVFGDWYNYSRGGGFSGWHKI